MATEMTANDVIHYIRLNPKEIYTALTTEHRTYQQSIVKSIYEILKMYSNNHTDLRNENAVAWAKEATAKEHFFPFI
jgi:hypothetical protein